MLTKDLASYPDKTLREVLSLWSLCHRMPSEKKAIRRDIATKLSSPRWGMADIAAIRRYLEPYVSYRPCQVTMDYQTALKLSQTALVLTGSRDVKALMEAIATGEVQVVPRQKSR